MTSSGSRVKYGSLVGLSPKSWGWHLTSLSFSFPILANGGTMVATLQCVLRMKEDKKCDELGTEPVCKRKEVKCYLLLLEIDKPIENDRKF